MVIDTSALAAILIEEPGWEVYADQIRNSTCSRMSAPSFLEASIVLRGEKGEAGVRALRLFVDAFDNRVEPFTELDAEIAIEAHRRYGKGMSHPARLNILDTCTNALATQLTEPLLFKGNDFSRTDLKPAQPTSAR